ncbi:DUF3561 family protein [Musicola paradisiaca]|uniref:DUF3561 family protein n=1 Tax=Musicola paradisiaca (strain Ech703) TaxID=579405 RepID=C6CAX5_MUSP7|nr:DUF3561 family protein [Musicola paradisiaca]ACS84675.1 conserved hypothetical protein [Musicola paradisiaca Ech703]
MQSVTPLSGSDAHSDLEEDTSSSSGALAGFCFYLLVFSLLLLMYEPGSTLLLMLYTWPFFLALMPLSILAGVVCRVLWPHHVVLMLLCCGGSIFAMFWLVFSLIVGW